MPKLNVTWRRTPPASPRLRQRLMAAGDRLYRTIQRTDVFCWHDEPGSGAVPQRRRRARPAVAKKTPRRPGRMNKTMRRPRRSVPLVADVPADAFIAWLGRLYQPRR